MPISLISTMMTPPPVKYDRQLRLWGDAGQKHLSHSSVLFLNCPLTGTESLKNLVLPGIHSYTIIDPSLSTSTDLGNNLFLASLPPHTPRASAIISAMNALNPSVIGRFIPQHADHFLPTLESAISFLQSYSIIIVSQIRFTSPLLHRLSIACATLNLPMIIARAVGMMGYIRVQAPTIFVMDAKEEGLIPDLRLYSPFESLEAYMDEFDMGQIGDLERKSQVPALVIAGKALEAFKKQKGRLPSSVDRKTYEQIVEQWSGNAQLQNFQQARTFFRACCKAATDFPENLKQLLEDKRSSSETEVGFVVTRRYPNVHVPNFPEPVQFPGEGGNDKEARDPETCIGVKERDEYSIWFWTHIAAIRVFVEKHNILPLSGVLPDLDTDTESFVRLQRIYSEQAMLEANECLSYAFGIIQKYDIKSKVDIESMRSFCKSFRSIHVLKTRCVVDELKESNDNFKETADIEAAMTVEKTTLAAPFYVMLRATDMLHREHGRCAGKVKEMKEVDERLTREYAANIKRELGLVGSLWEYYECEMVRFADAEIHNVAAYMGGIVAQEATKILTHQFKPVLDTIVVNFASMKSVVFQA